MGWPPRRARRWSGRGRARGGRSACRRRYGRGPPPYTGENPERLGRYGAGARPGGALDLLRRDLVPGVADDRRVDGRAAAAVGDQDRRALGVGQVLIAPLAQRRDRGIEVAALLGQVVL